MPQIIAERVGAIRTGVLTWDRPPDEPAGDDN